MVRSFLNTFQRIVLVIGMAAFATGAQATEPSFDAYFKNETVRIANTSLSNVHSRAEWQERQPELRREVAEMLGLNPLPERSPLNAVITGRLEEPDFTVEKLYFESRPHLYVTANLYLPKALKHPAPAILYLCGHAPVVSNGVSFGNKTAYQHHGIWFARNGYFCLIVDTLQYGEIQGHHRGTFDENQWWWNSRGYTPAGVETWNAIRALDYLDSRPEVDTNRIGITGRSGGGAYSWFLAAIDDRVKVIAPVSGVTDLQNYVVDGAVDLHCDCMFMVNTYRWDYPLLAALCAPRPLLLGNADADQLFPLDGVMRTRNFVKQIYDLYDAATNFGIAIGPGPHKDTPEMQTPVFHWFNLNLKQDSSVPVESAGPKLFSPQDLKVFNTIPADQINSSIQDSFVPAAKPPEIPKTVEEWQDLQKSWMENLRAKCFAGWPEESESPPLRQLYSVETQGLKYEAYEIQSQTNVVLPFCLVGKEGSVKPTRLELYVADDSMAGPLPNRATDLEFYIAQAKRAFNPSGSTEDIRPQIEESNVTLVVFFPRCIGTGSQPNTAQAQITLRRKFMLLGQTLDGMRVWDIHRAVEALRSLPYFQGTPMSLLAKGNMGVNALYASLFTPEVDSLELRQMPNSHQFGPDYLNVLKILDLPSAAAMAAEHCRLQLQSNEITGWDFLNAMDSSTVAKLKLTWRK